ncbi:bifunctional folylpolyglutamate synthase/dihydrofolate synthase [Sporosarcina obsidiansis]|uniref:bifunctional folylpolyglutamate synthase/dihydrofolate synthase n=1 Tax=Sporosarcina obsidiansis TaxID=2660748 RepID=UPI001891939F|nr:folylpolyglutamate synthase/dihydrofolate synthase family protein [Sporosarcina obsidiansis]
MIPKLDEYKKQFELESDDSIKLGLDAVRVALAKVGHPEKDLQIIHVAGTNGKGSTIAVMEAVLRAHGYTTGVFSSPAIYDIHDQIRLNGSPISQDLLASIFMEMKTAGLSGTLTDFELLTVAALLAFRKVAPDYCLIEAGMGGKLDSTNVVRPLVSVITSIALDHTGFLGHTIQEITEHKAGIIKPGTPVIIGDLPNEAEAVVEETAQRNRSRLVEYGRDFVMGLNRNVYFKGIATFELPSRKMKGPHQAINHAVALEALLQAGISLEQELVAKAIANVQLPFRFQKINDKVYIDGAHNPAAARMLVRTIEEEFPGETVDWVVGMLNTKDYAETLKILALVANSFTFVDFPHPQAARAEDLQAVCPISHNKIVSMEEIDLKSTEKYKKFVVGSLYLLSSLMRQ